MPRTVLGTGFAAETEVSVSRSKAQLEALLLNHGAEGFHTGWKAPRDHDPGWDAVEFLWKGKQIRFTLPRINRAQPSIQCDGAGRQRKPDVIERLVVQLDRQRWRVLYLVVKAKLEAVEAGVAMFEEEFLAFIVTASGRTVGEILTPQLQAGTTALQLEAGK